MAKTSAKSKRKKTRSSAPETPGRGPRTASSLAFTPFMPWLKAFVIVAAGAWALSPVLHGGWGGDDGVYLQNNDLLKDPQRIVKAWFAPGSFIEYYPIEQTVQWFQFKLWGLKDAYNYLLTNLVLHLVSALLVWHLFGKLGLKLAWIGGLIFAIHPLLVDTVGLSNELKNTLSLPPFLLAMRFFLDFEQSRKERDYLLALLLFLMAMLCKITMAFFPVVMLLYAWWKRGRVTWQDCLVSAPFFAISVILSFLTMHAGAVYAQSIDYVSPGPIHLGGAVERMALAGLCLGFYFGHCFLPLHPMLYYPLWSMEPLTLGYFVPWLGIVLVLACCWIKRDSWGRPVFFALAFFVLGLAPFLGLNEVSYMCLVWVQDHLLYIPIIALIALVVAGLAQGSSLIPRKFLPAGVAVLTLVLALLGLQTRSYAELFANREQLWRYNLQYNPNMWLVQYLLGNILANKGELNQALELFQESTRINPDFCSAQGSLGLAYYDMGKTPEAIDAYNAALRDHSQFNAARLNLAIALIRANRTEEAIDQLNLFLKSQPDFAKARFTLGCALAGVKRMPEAIEQLSRAVQLEPDNQSYRDTLQAVKNMSQGGPSSQ